MKKTKFLPFSIPLQFFASENASDGNVISDNDAASSEAENLPGTASADEISSGDQPDEEFEKLIKGGKFENAFKKRVQGIIDKRFKNLKALEEAQANQKPLLDFLSEKYGIDSSDPGELLKKMQNENRASAGKENSKAETPEQKSRDEIISAKAELLSKRWSAEGEELKKIFPGFDFRTELKNPVFSSLLKSGLPVRKAYTSAHSDEILKNAVSGTAKRVAEQTLKSIRAQGSRVAENGLHNGAGIIRKTDVASLTGEEIRSILKQVENGSVIRF